MADQRTVIDAVHRLSAGDRVIAGLVACHGMPSFGGTTHGRTRFAALARSILYQQLAGKAALAIHGRFVDAVGGDVTPRAVLACPEETLRACGLSGAKAASIRDLAAKVTDGTIALDRIGRLSDDAIVDHLVQVRGIGRWTAEMFLLFTLGRLDVWPTGDFGVRVGYATAWETPTVPAPKELQTLGDRFRPYRSIVAWYCWRAADERTRGPRPPPLGTTAPGEVEGRACHTSSRPPTTMSSPSSWTAPTRRTR